MSVYRAEREIRSHLVAFSGAVLGGVVLALAGFFGSLLYLEYLSGGGDEVSLEGVGYFLFVVVPVTVVSLWWGQVAGCGLFLRLGNYERAGLTSVLLFLLAPVGLVLSIALCAFLAPGLVGNGPPSSALWLGSSLVPMLVMPLLARRIALAKRPRKPRSFLGG